MDKTRGKKLPFVNKLLEILDRAEFNDIIHWDMDGTAIVVKRVLQFESLILPKYFDSSRMDSFSRQLNIYGFKRISDSRKQKTIPSERTSAFQNPHFIRGRPDLLHLISRTKNPRKCKQEPKYNPLTSTPQMPDTFGFNSSPHTNTTTGMFDLPFYPPQPYLPTNAYQDNISNNLFTYAYPNEFSYFYYPTS